LAAVAASLAAPMLALFVKGDEVGFINEFINCLAIVQLLLS
jgi:hypothetical protein